VFVLGLSPMLTFWIGGMLSRFLQRKLWQRAQADISVATDQPAPTREDEAADRRLTALISRDVNRAPKPPPG
jgi:hypothetical protein